jgi:hypothetical protein
MCYPERSRNFNEFGHLNKAASLDVSTPNKNLSLCVVYHQISGGRGEEEGKEEEKSVGKQQLSSVAFYWTEIGGESLIF